MKLANITKIFRLGKNPAVLSPERAVRNDFAWMCRTCGWTMEGLNQGCCHNCGKTDVFHPLSLDKDIQEKAKSRDEQRAKVQTTIRAAQQRRDEHNTLAFLTAPELPPKNAA